MQSLLGSIAALPYSHSDIKNMMASLENNVTLMTTSVSLLHSLTLWNPASVPLPVPWTTSVNVDGFQVHPHVLSNNTDWTPFAMTLCNSTFLPRVFVDLQDIEIGQQDFLIERRYLNNTNNNFSITYFWGGDNLEDKPSYFCSNRLSPTVDPEFHDATLTFSNGGNVSLLCLVPYFKNNSIAIGVYDNTSRFVQNKADYLNQTDISRMLNDELYLREFVLPEGLF